MESHRDRDEEDKEEKLYGERDRERGRKRELEEGREERGENERRKEAAGSGRACGRFLLGDINRPLSGWMGL